MIPMNISANRNTTAAIVILVAIIFLQIHPSVSWVSSHVTTNIKISDYNLLSTRRYLHTAVISPFATFTPLIPGDCERDERSKKSVSTNIRTTRNDSKHFSRLCRFLNASPTDLLRFDSKNADGVRGIYLNHCVKAGDVLLSLPLESCLVDQQPPQWLGEDVKKNPDKWATRLAACWIDLYVKQQNDVATDDDNDGTALWMSLFPNPKLLKASLPVHWPEEIVQNARSTSLEIAVDSAYFTRAEAVQDLVESLEQEKEYKSLPEKEELAHHALDLVQTRSCRLERKNVNDNDHNAPYCRVLAPGFDFINHGGRCDSNSYQVNGNANALFEMETLNDKEYLVVRAVTDLAKDEEILIDYGSSARPAWKCLMSYGFVPQYNAHVPEDNLAEVYMFGKRYDITTDTIPFEMVEAASAAGADIDEHGEINAPIEEVRLTSDVARKIAERLQEVGFFLLLEPDLDPYEDFDESETSQELSLDATQVVSHTLAASLRWSQHKVLLACAKGLEEFAQEQEREI